MRRFFCLSLLLMTFLGLGLTPTFSTPLKAQAASSAAALTLGKVCGLGASAGCSSLPALHSGKPAVWVVGFDPKQQAQLEQWLAAGLGLKSANSQLWVGEVAVVSPKWKAFEGQFKNQLPGLIQNKSLLPHVYFGFWEASALRQKLGVAPATQQAVILLDKQHQKVWMHQGAFNAKALTGLKAKVATLG
jgi:hypothetical protein